MSNPTPNNLRGLVVCVNYDDLLAITLPRNLRYLKECLVITDKDDERTQALCRDVPNVRVHVTDAFTRNGARFNKGLAIEEGLDVLGREGWILIWDADTLLPDAMPSLHSLPPGKLYGAPRRMLEDATQWSEAYDWSQAPLASATQSLPGYFHLFYADDAVLNRRPWYATNFRHAGGSDGYFQSLWLPYQRQKLPECVLHLGPRDTNWFGRLSPRRDALPLPVELSQQAREDLTAFHASKGWRAGGGLSGLAPVPNAYRERLD